MNLYLKLNSDLHKSELCEELNLFRKIVLQESSAVDELKFIFEITYQKFIPTLSQPIKYS